MIFNREFYFYELLKLLKSTKKSNFAIPKNKLIIMSHTDQQYDQVAAICRDIFTKKMKDYGASWRILRPASVTDQIFIKANRIRSIETKGVSKVDEGIRSELIAIVNYGIIGLIQLELGCSDTDDLSYEKGVELYTKYLLQAKKLMMDKNHDYDEAWRTMRMESYTDLILMKIYRTKQIEDNLGKTLISEGIDANYFDMINYAVFGLIKMEETNN
jgi:hypothetical protein